jgi:hypothetical protein
MRCLVLFLFSPLIFLSFSAVALAEGAASVGTQYSATSEKGYVYELTIAAEQPEVMKPLPVTIKVRDAEGALLPGATIRCSLTMPAMAMPKNMPPVRETEGDGSYQSTFLLNMGGLWHVELTSTFSSGEQDFVAVPIPGVSSGQDGDAVNDRLEELFQEKGGSKG